LNYEQTTYDEVTTIDGVQYKMNQLTGAHVLAYGCDDTITCSALHNFYKLHMQLDHHYDVYLDVEIDAMYAGAQAFVDGVGISLKRLNELVKEDDVAFGKAWAVLRQFLIAHNWVGSVPPVYGTDITAAEVKEAFEIFTGAELETKVRKIEKLVEAVRDAGQELLAQALQACSQSAAGAEAFTRLVHSRFTGEPAFKVNSPKQKATVLYELLSLPVRLRGEVTDNMRAGGIREGNPKANALAMAYALKYDVPEGSEVRPILAALSEMQIVQTRRGLYWNTYPNFVHWKTGKVHPSNRQSATNTRRWTCSKPNITQVSKHPKAEGETPKVREVYVPHRPDAVIVSMDEDAQELRIIADYSQDPNMVACFVGEHKKKMHALTGLGILKTWDAKYADWDYDTFMAAYKAHDPEVVKAYTIGKKVNFTTEYGAQAPKLAETLIIPEDEAQLFIDAKEEAFPVAREWKNSVEDEVRATGQVRTMCGAVRHLADALMSEDRYEASKALRQGVNTEVQSSSAEMIKRASGAMWRAGLRFKYDCRFMFPVHDEIVWSVRSDHLLAFLKEAHACMVQPFANMQIPIVSSIAFGKSFGPADQCEIGTEVSEEAVAAGLKAWQQSLEVAH
jgi:DNA polymerase I-like protein with 3'-5' exonuclease and polymerase domains